jgi:hypothetical protein
MIEPIVGGVFIIHQVLGFHKPDIIQNLRSGDVLLKLSSALELFFQFFCY